MLIELTKNENTYTFEVKGETYTIEDDNLPSMTESEIARKVEDMIEHLFNPGTSFQVYIN